MRLRWQSTEDYAPQYGEVLERRWGGFAPIL